MSAKHNRTTQGIKSKIQHPKLSKEACTALNACRQLAAWQYKDVLGETWNVIDKLTEELAVSHHKCICHHYHVQNELHTGHQHSCIEHKKTSAWNAFTWKKLSFTNILLDPEVSSLCGKEVLQGLVQSHQEEYSDLSIQEHKELVHKFEEQKATVMKAFCVSTKLRINDVTQTLSTIENESVLFVTCGTTEMPMSSIAFTTPGVENFLAGSMKVDSQDFLLKMEGFAVQGVQGLTI
ncbi:hypothetical protein L208DRAFT_1234855 [Tricholoma matsutake]|nr:hypothetical protein L208DRAFT_1234855 [Tricholoma matsutake 945]